MMAPTAAMALNGALAASFAGPAVPLAFLLAFVTIGCVAFAFVTFARVFASAASVGEFNTRGLNARAGALSAWALLLVYLLFTIGSAAECGAFAASALAYGHIALAWSLVALLALALCIVLGTRAATTSSRAMLLFEGISVGAILVLATAIFLRGGADGISLSPFTLHGTSLGGVGLATVFALLSFAGFEGAAVLGAESVEPTRTIPQALIVSVIIAGVLYVALAFAETIGFGFDTHGVARFAASASPLGDLAAGYVGVPFAAVLMAGAAISAFAATLASATGAARLLFSFGRSGELLPLFSRVDEASGTPVIAYLTIIGISALVVVAMQGLDLSGTDLFAACGTIAVLALVIVYGAVQIAALRLFWKKWNPVQRAIPIFALLCLAATFVANIVPVPHGPAAFYPYAALAWLILGALILAPTSHFEDR